MLAIPIAIGKTIPGHSQTGQDTPPVLLDFATSAIAFGTVDWGITNDLDETVTAQVAKDSSDVRWQVEEVHRGLKH